MGLPPQDNWSTTDEWPVYGWLSALFPGLAPLLGMVPLVCHTVVWTPASDFPRFSIGSPQNLVCPSTKIACSQGACLTGELQLSALSPSRRAEAPKRRPRLSAPSYTGSISTTAIYYTANNFKGNLKTSRRLTDAFPIIINFFSQGLTLNSYVELFKHGAYTNKNSKKVHMSRPPFMDWAACSLFTYPFFTRVNIGDQYKTVR